MALRILRRVLGTLAFSLSLAAAAAPASANCTAAERATADRQLRLNTRDQQASIAAHLPWGLPHTLAPSDHERLLIQRDYVIGYDAELRVPLWTAERVDARRL